MNKITRITTIRHGQTAYNVERRYAGTIDVPLDEKGIEDARIASSRLVDYEFDTVVTSGLRRAIQTADLLVGDRKLPTIQTELCNERDYGKMQGLTFVEVEDITPRIMYIKLKGDFHSVNPPGGEDFPTLRKRVKAFSQFLFQNYSGSNILVVSHGSFMQQLHGLFRGFDWTESLRYDIHNLACYTFTFEGRKLIENMPANLLIGNW